MLLLHVPEEQCEIIEEPGRELRADKVWFASRRAGRAYLGYMERQRDRMTGERGQMRVNRILVDTCLVGGRLIRNFTF